MSTLTQTHSIIGKRFFPMNGPQFEVVAINGPLVECAYVFDGVTDPEATRNFTVKELGFLFN